MSFVPEVIPAAYSLIEDRSTFAHVANLKYPQDRKAIAKLTLIGKQVWYAAQDPHQLIEADGDFHHFWAMRYVFPLKVKRFFYLFKFW